MKEKMTRFAVCVADVHGNSIYAVAWNDNLADEIANLLANLYTTSTITVVEYLSEEW